MSTYPNPNIGDIVYIKKDIFEPRNEIILGGYLAYRGDIVIVKDVYDDGQQYSVHHPSVKDNSFRVYRNEIMLTDPIITHNETKDYLNRRKFKSLDDRLEF